MRSNWWSHNLKSCVWTLWRILTEGSKRSDTQGRKNGWHTLIRVNTFYSSPLCTMSKLSVSVLSLMVMLRKAVQALFEASFRSLCTCISSCVVMRRRRQQSVGRLRLREESSGWGWGPVSYMHSRVNTSTKIICWLSCEYSDVSSVDARLTSGGRRLSKRAPVVNPVGDRRSWVKSNRRSCGSMSSCGLSTTSTSKETPIRSLQD